MTWYTFYIMVTSNGLLFYPKSNKYKGLQTSMTQNVEFCVCFIQNNILNIKNKTTKTKATLRFSIFGPPSCL